MATLRALAIIIILAVSGYLAYDTWMTNRAVESSFSGPAGALSIASSDPGAIDPSSVSVQQRAAYTVPADQPRYIYIPSIGLGQSRVMKVGVTSGGNIDVPKNVNDTAWYDGSAKPGQEGQVFIDAHTSFSKSVNSAFNNLPKIQNGAEIIIETGDGTEVKYRVVATETADYDKVDMKKALDTPVVDNVKAPKGLTLMTCTGTYDYKTKIATKRFVVYAVQV
jgi:LPXTG-site transpeptidase (sortase) family protein